MELTTHPLTPWSTTSETEPLRQAITGVPADIASIMTKPNGSGQSIGKRTAGEVARQATARGELADIAVKVRVGGVEPIAVARLSMEMK
jgi:hypothetical protein